MKRILNRVKQFLVDIWFVGAWKYFQGYRPAVRVLNMDFRTESSEVRFFRALCNLGISGPIFPGSPAAKQILAVLNESYQPSSSSDLGKVARVIDVYAAVYQFEKKRIVPQTRRTIAAQGKRIFRRHLAEVAA